MNTSEQTRTQRLELPRGELTREQMNAIQHQVAEVIAHIVLPAPKKTGRKSRRKEQLRTAFLITNAKSDRYQFKPEQIIRSLLMKSVNAALYPQRRRINNNEPWQTVYSQYRRWKGPLPSREKKRKAILPRDWHEAGLNDAVVLSLCVLLHNELEQCGDTRPDRLQVFYKWMDLAMDRLPMAAFRQLVYLGTDVLIRELLTGMHLQTEAEQARKPYQRPGEI